MRKYHSVFFKGRETLWEYNTAFIFDERVKKPRKSITLINVS
jgi:hypothetical protein